MAGYKTATKFVKNLCIDRNTWIIWTKSASRVHFITPNQSPRLEWEQKIIELMMQQYSAVAGRTGQYNMDQCLKGKPLQAEVTPHVKYNGKINYFPNSAIWSIFLLRGYMTSDRYEERKNCWLSVANEKYKRLLTESMHAFQKETQGDTENES